MELRWGEAATLLQPLSAARCKLACLGTRAYFSAGGRKPLFQICTGEADSAFEAREYKLSLQVTESPLSERQGSLLSGRRLRHQTQPRQPEKDCNPGKKLWGGAEHGTPDTGAGMICGCQCSLVLWRFSWNNGVFDGESQFFFLNLCSVPVAAGSPN